MDNISLQEYHQNNLISGSREFQFKTSLVYYYLIVELIIIQNSLYSEVVLWAVRARKSLLC